ncbi:hypothetical protein [Streptomyces arenae]|uniref:hypothetical protein n=1 Tax=Streptomyces arenae TaxID=29301 RepID=UPI00265AE13B|nr:hypothetical protein [Streptomyces arenae]MCG7205143.1 hypothetical protein [Streptomyces arenae]
MSNEDCEEDWKDDEERDVHACIRDKDTEKEIRVSTIRDADYERFIDFRVYNPSLKGYGEGITIHIMELHDFLEVIGDVVWQRKQRGRIEYHPRVYMADGMEIHVSTIREGDGERSVVLREYDVSRKEHGDGLAIPVGLLDAFYNGVTDAWHANGSGDWY